MESRANFLLDLRGVTALGHMHMFLQGIKSFPQNQKTKLSSYKPKTQVPGICSNEFYTLSKGQGMVMKNCDIEEYFHFIHRSSLMQIGTHLLVLVFSVEDNFTL